MNVKFAQVLLIIGITCATHVIAQDQPSNPRTNSIDDVFTVLFELDRSDTVSDGLHRAQRILVDEHSSADPAWNMVLERCLTIVTKQTGSSQKLAARVIPKLVKRFPERSDEVLSGLLIGLKLPGVEGVGKCDLIKAIGSIPVFSQASCDQLRPEIAMDTQNGECISVRAVVAIAKLTPNENERREMLRWLQTNLRHTKASVRWMCAEALGNEGKSSEFALNQIRELINDPNDTVIMCSAHAIWRIDSNDPSISESLCLEVLHRKAQDHWNRPMYLNEMSGSNSHTLALSLLKKLEPSSQNTIDYLTEQLESKNYVYRTMSTTALRNISPNATLSPQSLGRLKLAALRHFDSRSQIDAAEALKRLASREPE